MEATHEAYKALRQAKGRGIALARACQGQSRARPGHGPLEVFINQWLGHWQGLLQMQDLKLFGSLADSQSVLLSQVTRTHIKV